MQASLVLLGQVDPGRDLYQPRPVLPLERGGELAHRLHDPYPYRARSLASETQNPPKAFPDCRFSVRSLVRSDPPVSVIKALLIETVPA